MMKNIKKNNADKTMSKNMIIGIECFMEDVVDNIIGKILEVIYDDLKKYLI